MNEDALNLMNAYLDNKKKIKEECKELEANNSKEKTKLKSLIIEKLRIADEIIKTNQIRE